MPCRKKAKQRRHERTALFMGFPPLCRLAFRRIIFSYLLFSLTRLWVILSVPSGVAVILVMQPLFFMIIVRASALISHIRFLSRFIISVIIYISPNKKRPGQHFKGVTPVFKMVGFHAAKFAEGHVSWRASCEIPVMAAAFAPVLQSGNTTHTY